MATAFQYSGTELDSLAGAVNYYTHLAKCFAPFVGRRVVEVGAGVGTFARHLMEGAPGAELILVEPAGNNYPVLAERFRDTPRVTTRHGYLQELPGTAEVDAVVAVNVLEHVEDDAGFLRAAWSLLRPGGHLLLFVPAVPQIYGTLDAEFEHFRRYTRPALSERLERAGFELRTLRYTNLPGVLGWALLGKVLRRRTLHPRAVRTYDRWIFPLVVMAERYVSPPVGQSLVAVARRPEEDAGSPEGAHAPAAAS